MYTLNLHWIVWLISWDALKVNISIIWFEILGFLSMLIVSVVMLSLAWSLHVFFPPKLNNFYILWFCSFFSILIVNLDERSQQYHTTARISCCFGIFYTRWISLSPLNSTLYKWELWEKSRQVICQNLTCMTSGLFSNSLYFQLKLYDPDL